MNINFEYDDVKASNRLEIMTAKKLEKLLDKFDFIVRSDVLFKKENTSSPDTGMICKIRLSAPGPRFEASIAASVEDLQRQLEKKKAKMKSH